jgi:hypothetical protein
MTPEDRAQLLRQLAGYIRSLPAYRGRPEATEWLEATLLAAALEQRAVRFEWAGPAGVVVDGHPLRHRGIGIHLAWLALASEQPIKAAWIYPTGRRPGARALQALGRAAGAVERVSPALAAAIRALGVERGDIVMKRGQHHVDCTSDLLCRMISA